MIGRTISSRYKVYDKVGSGGMAEVFLARDLDSGEIVALKILREQFTEGEDYIERFEREAKSATKLDHPNICRIRDFGREDDVYYMVMEYVEGKTLSSIIEQKGPLAIQEAASYVTQVARALDHAYSRGLVAHRDIKSQNIMVTASGQVKIMDFGIAKSKDFATMTSAGSFVGTPEYMSPEQAQGEKVDKRSDLYSLGVVFYEALVGEVPFESDTPWGVLNMHINKEPFPLTNLRKDLPKDLVDIIERLMTKDLDERFQTPKELITTLDAVMENIKIPKNSRIKKRKVPRSNPKRARKIKMTLLIVFLVLIIGGGVYSYFAFFAPKPADVIVDTEPDGALIEIKGPNDIEYKTLDSDTVVTEGIADGDLTITDLSPGKYEIRVSLDGYIQEEVEFKLESGKDVVLEKIMLKKPGEMKVLTRNIDWGTVEETPSPKIISVSNVGQSTLVIKRTLSGNIFMMEGSDLSIPAGETIDFPISVDSTKLFTGQFSGLVVLEPVNGQKVTIDVKFEYIEPEPDIEVIPPTPNNRESNNGENSNGSSSGSSSGSGSDSGEETPPPPKTGSLQISSNVDGIAIMIDGKPAGNSPLTISGLTPGSHTVTASGGRLYKSYKRDVVIRAGETANLVIKLELK